MASCPLNIPKLLVFGAWGFGFPLAPENRRPRPSQNDGLDPPMVPSRLEVTVDH